MLSDDKVNVEASKQEIDCLPEDWEHDAAESH